MRSDNSDKGSRENESGYRIAELCSKSSNHDVQQDGEMGLLSTTMERVCHHYDP